MKSKKIVIVYMAGFISNPAPREYLYQNLISELGGEGRVVDDVSVTKMKKVCRFKDGTTLTMIPFGGTDAMRAYRATHLYIEEDILKLGGGVKYAKEILFPMVVNKGNYVSMEADTEKEERVLTFSFNPKEGLKTKQL